LAEWRVLYFEKMTRDAFGEVRKEENTGMVAIVVVLYIYPDQHHKHKLYLLNFKNSKKGDIFQIIFSGAVSIKINFPD
jgi:hypothetical protein